MNYTSDSVHSVQGIALRRAKNSLLNTAKALLTTSAFTLLAATQSHAQPSNCQAQTPASQVVTGALVGGPTFGDNVVGYMTDSDLARISVHAGLINFGESAFITVTPLGILPGFPGSTQNGITTVALNNYPWCGMRLSRAGAPTPPPPPPPPPTLPANDNAQRSSRFEYDSTTGLLNAEVVEPDSVDHCVRTAYTLDSYGNRAGSTTSNCSGASAQAQFASRSTTSAWSGQSVTINGASVNVPAGAFATQITNALGQSESRQYDPRFGAMLGQTGPNGLATSWDMDDFGRKVLEIAPDGNRIVTRYCFLPGSISDTSANSAGCMVPTQAPSNAVSYVESFLANSTGVQIGARTRKYSDHLGRELREETEGFDGPGQPAGARTVLKDTEYNDYGAAVKVTQPYFASGNGSSLSASGAAAAGWTATDFDVLGRPVTVHVRDDEGAATYLGQPVAQASFSYNGLVVTETRARTSKNASGQQQASTTLTTTRTSNALGQLVLVADSNGGTLKKRFDAFANVVEARDALDNTVLTTFDVRGRKTQMADPNAGLWNYRYNALGELTGQLSPKAGSVWTTLSYDLLGRLTQRAEQEYTTAWSYDKYADNSSCAKGVGKLCEVTTSHGIARRMSYDSLGRPAGTSQTVTGGPSFSTSRTYDAQGRIATQTYPTGVALTYGYTALGYQQQINRGSTPIWLLKSVNAWGKPELYEMGGTAQSTAQTWDATTGRIVAIKAGDAVSQTASIMEQQYGWDTVGNLTDRSERYDSTNALTENFSYDSLNRLSSYQVSSPGISGLSRSVDVAYNAIGNIVSKSDVGTYSYPASGASSVRPGAVSGIYPISGHAPRGFTYDASGNLTSSSGSKYSSITYTSFNLPSELSGASGSYSWQYGPDHERVKETKGTRTTWYHHPDNQNGLSFEQEQGASGTVNRHYVSAMGRTIQMFETTPASPTTVSNQQWWHADQLGSVVAIADQSYAVTQRFSYDPFGKRRQINGTYDAFGALVYDHPGATDRGFTGHEHLDDVGVIHMNGRTYDPHIARFMQADPYIQLPDNGQNYNRFSYILNNPLNAMDPSGELFVIDDVVLMYAAAATVGARAVGVIDTKTARQIFGTIAAVAIAGMDVGAFGAGKGAGLVQAAVGGMAAGAISCGIECVGPSVLSAGLFYGVGQWSNSVFGADIAGQQHIGRAIAHGVAGCVVSASQGGGCGQGAASAFLNKALMSRLDDLNSRELEVARAAVIGGTLSAVGGGKFANGAMMGAFQYLYNQALSSKWWKNAMAKGAHGTAMLVKDFVDAGWIEMGTEFNIRTRSGIEGRVDAVLMYRGDGQTVYIVGEAKNGPYADLSARQKVYLQEIGEGKFEFIGPKGQALAATLMQQNASQLGVVVRGFGGSPAEGRPVGKQLNDALRDAAGRSGIRGGFLSE